MYSFRSGCAVALAATAFGGAVGLAGQAAGSSMGRCATHDLKITESPSQGAGGSFLLELSYRNVTRVSCQNRGFPGVTLLGARHQRLGVGRRVGTKLPRLVVKPNARVYGFIQYSETPHPPRRCRAVKAARIVAPNSTESSTVPLPNGSRYCSTPVLVYPLARSARVALR